MAATREEKVFSLRSFDEPKIFLANEPNIYRDLSKPGDRLAIDVSDRSCRRVATARAAPERRRAKFIQNLRRGHPPMRENPANGCDIRYRLPLNEAIAQRMIEKAVANSREGRYERPETLSMQRGGGVCPEIASLAFHGVTAKPFAQQR